jgi:hypothetical protein
MLLHDMQETVTLLVQWCRPLLSATRQLLEEVCHNVVQAGAAACAYHGIWKKEGQVEEQKYCTADGDLGKHGLPLAEIPQELLVRRRT